MSPLRGFFLHVDKVDIYYYLHILLFLWQTIIKKLFIYKIKMKQKKMLISIRTVYFNIINMYTFYHFSIKCLVSMYEIESFTMYLRIL